MLKRIPLDIHEAYVVRELRRIRHNGIRAYELSNLAMVQAPNL